MDETGKPRRPSRPASAKPNGGARPNDGARPGVKRAPKAVVSEDGVKRPAVRTQRTRIAPPAEPRRHEKTLEGLGALLKTKREINGLTRRDVVVKIKIPLEQLESIEDGRLSSLPPVFAKGFLRAYANELGLDAETILEDYRQMTGGFKNEPASREPLAPRYVETSVGPARWRPGLRTVVVALLVVAALAAAIWLWPSFRATLAAVMPFKDQTAAPAVTADPSPTTTPEPAPAAAADLDLSAAAAALNAGAFTFNSETESQFVEDPLAEASTGAATGSLAAAASALGAPIPEGGTLTLSSQQDKVWVQVVVDGQPPQYLWLKMGEKATWQAKQYITVTAGQATALSVNWNGQDLGPLGSNSNPIVETTFPKRG